MKKHNLIDDSDSFLFLLFVRDSDERARFACTRCIKRSIEYIEVNRLFDRSCAKIIPDN